MRVDDTAGIKPIAPLVSTLLPTLSATQVGPASAMTVTDFVLSRDFAATSRRIARAVARQPSVRLGVALPGLGTIENRPLDRGALPARISNRMDDFGWQTWADLAASTTGQILEMRSIGADSLIGLLEVAIKHSLLGAATVAGGTFEEVRTVECGRGEESDGPPNDGSSHDGSPERLVLSADVGAALALLARWATVADGPPVTLGRIVAEASEATLPQDVADAAHLLRDRPLVGGIICRAGADAGRLGHLLDVLDEDARTLVRGRAPVRERLTLDDIAGRRGITRERVRQLEVKARRELDEQLVSDGHAELRWDLDRLRRVLGIGIRVGAGDAVAAARHGLPRDVLDLNAEDAHVLLWLAGPYRVHADGWLRRDDLPEVAEVGPFVGSEGRVDLAGVHAHLCRRGLVPEAADAWLGERLPTRRVRDTAVAWTGSIVDKLARVLAVHDEPAEVEHLLALAGEQHSVRSVRGALMADDRFARVDVERFGLRAWGMDEYGGLAAAIAEELGRRADGSGDVDDVVAIVAHRFGAKPSSIRYFTMAPMFVVSDGRLRLRRPGEAFPVPDDPVTSGGVARLSDDSVQWQFEVDAEHLRGSGRVVRPALALWAGVVPGGPGITFATVSDGEGVRMTWPGASPQPMLASIRRQLLAVGAVAGDRVHVRIDRASRRLSVEMIGPLALPTTGTSSQVDESPQLFK